VHGASASGALVFRKKLRRDRVLKFLAVQPACTVAMEAGASSRYRGREIAKLGHEIRLIAPDYVKPFVKRQKNDSAEAEAICEATQRPTVRFVAVKGGEQQADAVVFRARDPLIRQRTKSSMRSAGIWLSSGWWSQRALFTSPSSWRRSRTIPPAFPQWPGQSCACSQSN
jgi:transposase